MSEAIASQLQHGQLEIITGASHLSAIEQPERFTALIQQFMLGL
jgi:pimeloyl-ACP methyl ester carboxylesterase